MSAVDHKWSLPLGGANHPPIMRRHNTSKGDTPFENWRRDLAALVAS